MAKAKLIQATTALIIFTSLVFSSGLNAFADRGNESNNVSLQSTTEAAGAAIIADNSTFYTLRPDRRRCMLPMCGGYFIRRVNLPTTRCVDGRSANECYVAEIDWNGQPQVDINRALLRGTIVVRTDKRFGKVGTLKVMESWQAASENNAAGNFYRVRDRGLRCITFPCPTHLESQLNFSASRNIAGIDLTGANATESSTSDAFTAMTSGDGILAAGRHEPITGPAGRSETLKASQFYLRAGTVTVTKPRSTKPCFRTGCSSEICADHNVMSPCMYRKEFACYKKATCERQADGNCGYTKTPELEACLARQ